MRQEVLPTAWARLWQGQRVWQAPRYKDKLQQQARGCTLDQRDQKCEEKALRALGWVQRGSFQAAKVGYKWGGSTSEPNTSCGTGKQMYRAP